MQMDAFVMRSDATRESHPSRRDPEPARSKHGPIFGVSISCRREGFTGKREIFSFTGITKKLKNVTGKDFIFYRYEKITSNIVLPVDQQR